VNDDRMARVIGIVLRLGVALAAVVVLAGGVWYLASAGSSSPDYHEFHRQALGLHAFASLPGPQAVILVGLLILIATPIARVTFSLVAFHLEGDRTYVVITLVVLAVLLYSIGTACL